jgi:hypothetical protein
LNYYVVVVVVDAVVVVVVVGVVVAVVVVVFAVSHVVVVVVVAVVQADQCNHPSIPLDTMPPHVAGAAALPALPQLVMLYDLVRIAFIASSNAAHYEAYYNLMVWIEGLIDATDTS